MAHRLGNKGDNCDVIYGVGGVIAPFIGIKLIDVIVAALRLA